MTTPANHPTRSIIVNLLKWLFAIGLLSMLLWVNRHDLIQLQYRKILWGVFAAALGVRVLSLIATFSRWRLLVRGIGLPFSFRESFRLGMLGEACNLIGPGAVGGDLVKVALLAKDYPHRIASVMATVFLDRVLGLWSLFFLGAVASILPLGTKPGPELQYAIWILWGGAAAGIIGMGLMFIPSFTHSRLMHWLTTWKFIGRIVKELMDSIQLYQGKPQIVVGAAALALFGHFGFLTSFYFCAQALNSGQDFPGYIDHIVGLPLPEAISAIPLTPGGLGVLEKAVSWFYQQHQLTVLPDSTKEQIATAGSNGLITAFGYRLTMLIWGAVGVLFYLASRGEIRKAVDQTSNDSPNLGTVGGSSQT